GRMVRIEGIRVRVGDDDVGRELADDVHDLRELIRADLERIVAEIERDEVGAEGPSRLLRLLVADPLYPLDRLAAGFPELPGFTSLTVREGDHTGDTAATYRHRDRPSRTPDEVRGMRAHDEQPTAHPTVTPARVRELTTVIVRMSLSESPCATSRS